MSGTLYSLAQMPVARRDYPVAPEPVIPAGVPTMQAQGSGFAPLDTVDPTALMMLRAGVGQTVPETSRLWQLATDAATNFAGTTPMRGVSPTISPDGSVLVDGRLVGRVRIDRDGPAFRIADIEISPAERRQGFGSAVIRQIQDEAAGEGRPVVLSTDAMRGRQAQIDQRRLYERLGFTPNTGADRVGQRIGKSFVAEELVWRPK